MVLGDIPIVFQTRLQRLVSFFLSPFNLVDLLAILPWYIEYFMDDDDSNNMSGA